MQEPRLSPKIEAYIRVMSELHDLRIKRGIYPADYTREVNAEIDRIRARLMASARRAQTAEQLAKMFEENPELARKWKLMKLQTGYINAVKRQDKIYKEIKAQEGAQP